MKPPLLIRLAFKLTHTWYGMITVSRPGMPGGTEDLWIFENKLAAPKSNKEKI